MTWKKYTFEATCRRDVREIVVARSEEEAREVLPPTPVPTITDWTLLDVEDA